MRALVLFGLSLIIVSISALLEVKTNYHDAIGIPTAERILAQEKELLLKRSQDDRIVGGVIAPATAHPYFAGLLISFHGITTNSVCGASLLTANRLVTAAHCWNDGQKQASQFLVILGSNLLSIGGQRIATTQVVPHPNYISQFLANDVAVIYLPSNAVLSLIVQPIRLPSNAEIWDTFAGRWAIAAGFGKTSDQQAAASVQVSHVALQVIMNESCESVYGINFVRHSTLCTSGTGGVGVCGGDSGGPLALYTNSGPALIGISSFTASGNCQGGHPSAFARVTSFHSFITQHL